MIEALARKRRLPHLFYERRRVVRDQAAIGAAKARKVVGRLLKPDLAKKAGIGVDRPVASHHDRAAGRQFEKIPERTCR